jgi:hypothetical protein
LAEDNHKTIKKIMTNLNAVKKVALGMALSGLFTWQASALIAYATTTDGATINTPGASVVANQFYVVNPITMNQIGAYDPSGGSFGSPGVEVAIYQETAGVWDLVAGTEHTFTGAPAAGSMDGGYSWYWTGQITLTGGTYAVVAANYGTAANPYYTGTTTFSSNPYDVISEFAYSVPGLSSTLPSSFNSAGVNFISVNPLGAGNFEYVPEAAGFATAGVGLLGLVYIGRCLPRRKIA